MRTRTHLPPLARRLLAGPAALMLGSLVLLPLAASEATPQAQNRGCLTRPPGFWASHPAIATQYLSEGLGTLPQDPQKAGDAAEAIRDLCAVGEDAARLAREPQQARLVRQCSAAHLNVAATRAGGGSCTAEVPYLRTLLERCCGVEVLNTGNAPERYGIEHCVAVLEGFNNTPDTLAPFGPFLNPVTADTRACQPVGNDGAVNRR
jgi:hypothetical protein